MSGATARSVALVGMEATVVEIEAFVGPGLPRTVLVGLPDASLYEARDRCKAAVASSGLTWPNQLLTINLTPATLPKTGSHYDIGIVAAVLAAEGTVPRDRVGRVIALGELGLDGRVRPVRGVLPALLAAAEEGYETVIVPASQVGEASLVEGLTVWGVATLGELIQVLRGYPVVVAAVPAVAPGEVGIVSDFSDVLGQEGAKFALEVAAAGRHHTFLHGPPGVGKTMLAERLPTLLPELTLSEALEVSAVHSLAGLDFAGLVRRPPFADPHPSASLASMVGGGSKLAKPGSISRAHRGVLFLDEAPEFAPRILDALRAPLESGQIVLGRADYQVRYPARFQLVLAANPCPCGMASTPGSNCRCAPMAIRRYASRVSGPLLDRIDIHQTLQSVRGTVTAVASGKGESSVSIRHRVEAARERQASRLVGTQWRTNAEVSGSYLRGRLPLPDGIEVIDDAVRKGRLSSRGVDKVLRLSWTMADLRGCGRPQKADVRAALAMRQGEDLGRGAA